MQGPVVYTREQLLDVRRQIQLLKKASALDLGITKNTGTTRLTPIPADRKVTPMTVAVVKKVKSSGDAASTPGTQTRAFSAGDATMMKKVAAATAAPSNIWEQRRQARSQQQQEAAVVTEKKAATEESAVGSSSQNLSVAEEFANQQNAASSSSSFSADDRARLAQLREHLKNRTLASQLRPMAQEFRPTSDEGKKHWSRDWAKKDESKKEEKAAKAAATPSRAADADGEEAPAAAPGNLTWAQRARTASPSLSKIKTTPMKTTTVKFAVESSDPSEASTEPAEHIPMTVVGSNDEVDANPSLPTAVPVPHQVQTAEKKDRSPSKRRVPPPRNIGQLRERNEADLTVDFRDLIPTADVTGKVKPMHWEEQQARMKEVAKLLLAKDARRTKAQIQALSTPAALNRAASNSRKKAAEAAEEGKKKPTTTATTTKTTENGVTTVVTKAKTPLDLIDQLNARANAGVPAKRSGSEGKKNAPVKKNRPPTFREHQATRARSAILRPMPVVRPLSRKATKSMSKHQKAQRAQSVAKYVPKQSVLTVMVPQQPKEGEKPLPGADRSTLCTKKQAWEQYIPDLAEFPEDYTALFADWSYANLQAEAKLHKVTDDTKLLETFKPEHVETIVNQETGIPEDYTMLWVDGIYTQVPVASVTASLIRKSQEAARIYEGVDAKNMSLKSAYIAHKRAQPAERKARQAARREEVRALRKKIEAHLETGLDQCDKKAAEVIPLATVMRDSRFDGLILSQKVEICRARRIRFLKAERLAMVERIARQHGAAVLDVIAVLHTMMEDRIESRAKKGQSEEDEHRFARMLAKRDMQVRKLVAKQEEAGAVPAKKEEKMVRRTGAAVEVQPLKESEEELRRRVAARKKHIQIAMRTPGYQIWLKVKDLPDEKYKVKFPVVTPVPEQLCSKRAWDGLVRQWRQRLHQYDQFAPEILNRTVFVKEDIEAHHAKVVPSTKTKDALLLAPQTPEQKIAAPVVDATAAAAAAVPAM